MSSPVQSTDWVYSKKPLSLSFHPLHHVSIDVTCRQLPLRSPSPDVVCRRRQRLYPLISRDQTNWKLRIDWTIIFFQAKNICMTQWTFGALSRSLQVSFGSIPIRFELSGIKWSQVTGQLVSDQVLSLYYSITHCTKVYFFSVISVDKVD